MTSAAVFPDIEVLDHAVSAQTLPAEFSIIRVYLKDGRCREATWTGDVWWLRNGAVVQPDEVEAWESLPPIPEGLCHANFAV